MNNLLLIIDPQNDFVDPKGSLYVPGAEKNIPEFHRLLNSDIKFSDIVVSQDTHHDGHCSFASAWVPGLGKEIKPGVQITEEDIGDSDPLILSGILKNGPITIWPEHCIEGTWGYKLPTSLENDLFFWVIKTGKEVYYQHKGTDSWYEAYSLLTEENLLGSDKKQPWRTKNYDHVYVTGFCKDICVAETVKDLISTGEYEGKLIFVRSCLGVLDPKSPKLEIYKDAIKNHGAIEI